MGMTEMHIAYERGFLKLVNAMIKKNHPLTIPIDSILIKNDLRMIKAIIENYKTLFVNFAGHTVHLMTLAILFRNYHVADMLLFLGCDMNLKDCFYLRPLDYSVINFTIFTKLLNCGYSPTYETFGMAIVNCKKESFLTLKPLFPLNDPRILNWINYSDVGYDFFLWLISLGLDLNIKDEFGRGFFDYALLNGNYDFVSRFCYLKI
jgi:hypothetical protein